MHQHSIDLSRSQDVFGVMKLFFLLIWFAICAEQDARCKQISNELTLGAAALAIIYGVDRYDWLGSPALEALLAVTTALALTLPGYALGKLGAADVKLMTALALASNSAYLLCTFIGAGVAMATGLIVGKSARRLHSNGLRNAIGI